MMSNGNEFKPKEVLKRLQDLGYVLCVDDNGHSWHKITALLKKGVPSIDQLKIPSIVGDTARNKLSSGINEIVNAYRINDVSLTCGSDLKNPIDVRTLSYQHSAENIALTAHGIDRFKAFDKKIILGVTCPISRYYKEGVVDQIKKAYGSADIIRESDGAKLQVADVEVLAEGHIAVYDWIITDDFKINEDAKKTKKLLVVDIGGGTTDVVTIVSEGKVSVDQATTGTIEGCGIIDVIREVKVPLERAMSAAFANANKSNFFSEVTQGMIEGAIRDNGLWSSNHLNVHVDIGKELIPIRTNFVKNMIHEVGRIASNLDTYDRILFAGGGALLLENELKMIFPGAVYLDEWANSKGMLKFMLNLWLKKNYQRFMD